MKTKNSKSVKRFIRSQKAKIRIKFWDAKKQSEEIAEMYRKISQNITEPVKVAKPAAKVVKKTKAPKAKKEKSKK